MSRVIAVDLGGTNLRVALVEGKRILKLIKIKTPKRNLTSEIIKEINKLGGSENQVKGIGIGAPGILHNGKFVNSSNLRIPGDIKKRIQIEFRKKVVIENDANCVALAEAKYGWGKGKKNFIILTIGTGIGGGIIIDGKLYKGGGAYNGEGFGGEFSSMILEKHKNFEYYGGAKGLKRLGQKGRSKYLGIGISNLINILDPEIVVLAGGAREEGSKLLNMIKKEARKHSIRKNIGIVWSKLKEPGVIGAGLLVS
jgi:predicted NBD/HSP70 family sugar kinase